MRWTSNREANFDHSNTRQPPARRRRRVYIRAALGGMMTPIQISGVTGVVLGGLSSLTYVVLAAANVMQGNDGITLVSIVLAAVTIFLTINSWFLVKEGARE